jgi:hypothetical protein
MGIFLKKHSRTREQQYYRFWCWGLGIRDWVLGRMQKAREIEMMRKMGEMGK